MHEMFGYDIMVDEDFNCWLIEINSSPAMDYSTHVTERLVKMVLEDTIKVLLTTLALQKRRRSEVKLTQASLRWYTKQREWWINLLIVLDSTLKFKAKE